jgi:hypothetical protein
MEIRHHCFVKNWCRIKEAWIAIALNQVGKYFLSQWQFIATIVVIIPLKQDRYDSTREGEAGIGSLIVQRRPDCHRYFWSLPGYQGYPSHDLLRFSIGRACGIDHGVLIIKSKGGVA